MAPTPEQTELGYHRMWDRAQIKPDKTAQARKIARAIIANRARYAAVEQATGVPWFMIGPIHARESDMDFSTHLHNGDSLKARTHHVPAGRPRRGNPPFPWDASAIDALTMPPHELQKVKAWSVERILYETDANGDAVSQTTWVGAALLQNQGGTLNSVMSIPILRGDSANFAPASSSDRFSGTGAARSASTQTYSA